LQEFLLALTIPDNIERSATPICEHFGECGGCSMQDIEYDKQVELKSNILSEMFERKIDVVPSPSPYAFRHRMDFTTAFGKVGMRKRGDGKTLINLTECHVVEDRVSKLIPQIQQWIEEFKIWGYNFITKKGDIRFITFRHALSSDELMIIVVTALKEDSTVHPLLEKLKGVAESVVWSVQERQGDDSHGEVQEIYGNELINQEISDKTFVVSPGCFFQNNLLLVDKMFDEIASHVDGYLMDLFCGTGTIGLYCSSKADKVLGVEIMEENIRLAEINKRNNKIENVEFIQDNANHFLAHYDGPLPDTVIIDPPRSGLAPKFIRKLNRLGAKKLVYVSCNPKTYKNDLELLERYELVDALGFDMFPHTPHVELVTLLELR